MVIRFKPSFVRDFKKLSDEIQGEAFEKIERFKDDENHSKLKVHKLNGKLKNSYSFSVNYSHRIVFEYEEKNVVVFLAIGTHDIYR